MDSQRMNAINLFGSHMETTKEQLLRTLQFDRQNLEHAFARIDVGSKNSRRSEDRWSPAEILEHLLLVETRILSYFTSLPAVSDSDGDKDAAGITASSELPRNMLMDRSRKLSSPTAVTPTGKIDADDALAELQKVRAKLVEWLQSCEEQQLQKIYGAHPVLGPVPLSQWIGFVAAHEARHTEQMLELA
jgi:hypothetical protein